MAHKGKEAEVVVVPSNYCSLSLFLCCGCSTDPCVLVRQYVRFIFMGLDGPFGILGSLPSIESV